MYIRNAVVTSELAIRMAVESVRDKNILPGYIYIKQTKKKKLTPHSIIYTDIELNITRYYSYEDESSLSAIETFKMVESNVE